MSSIGTAAGPSCLGFIFGLNRTLYASPPGACGQLGPIRIGEVDTVGSKFGTAQVSFPEWGLRMTLVLPLFCSNRPSLIPRTELSLGLKRDLLPYGSLPCAQSVCSASPLPCVQSVCSASRPTTNASRKSHPVTNCQLIRVIRLSNG